MDTERSENDAKLNKTTIVGYEHPTDPKHHTKDAIYKIFAQDETKNKGNTTFKNIAICSKKGNYSTYDSYVKK
jgi:hypothetical protein